MEIIKVENLSKTYIYYKKEKGLRGSFKNLCNRTQLYKEAVKDLNFSIEQGSIIGLIGLNGAGKTTTLKMLAGILKPTCGNISILGYNPFQKKHEFLKQISMVMGNKGQLWWDIPAIDTFELNREIFEVDKKKYDLVIDELTQVLNVKHLLNVQVRRLSLGERMKMELISALIHSPSVLFLDEPTIGLDIISQQNVRQFLKYLNCNYKTTIILTSHNFDDIVSLCDRLLIIDNGIIICDNSFEDFLNKYSTKKILTIKLLKGTSQFFNYIKKNNIEILDEKIDEIKISIDNREVMKITNEIMNSFFSILRDISIEDVDIKEIIRDIYS